MNMLINNGNNNMRSNSSLTEHEERKIERNVSTKDLFRQLEEEHHGKLIRSGRLTRGGRGRGRYKKYRSTLEMVRDAVEKCRQPTKTYQIIKYTQSEKEKTLIWNIIKSGLITENEDDLESITWVITAKGEQFLEKVDSLIRDYPFIINQNIVMLSEEEKLQQLRAEAASE